ncbi:vascular cell adhesion protein 1-like [Megalops cyprinoides]|uniref:vascular cell adhesion protein 1-like n=1 Tax=Megalops cyprinoides TaxID=118141 RepID=UPI00186493F2|nr:vascular cell adhesion protein 1-like [Megalops cyprinoides]
MKTFKKNMKMTVIKIVLCISLQISAVSPEVDQQVAKVIISPDRNVVNVIQGTSFQFTCSLTGKNCKTIEYEWRKPVTQDFDKTTFAKKATLSFPSVTYADADLYTCAVTCDGEETSKNVKMKVFSFDGPVLTMPSILKEGETFPVTCSTNKSHHISNMDINWYIGGKLVKNDTKYMKDNIEAISTLMWTPERMDHGKILTCAVNLTDYDVVKEKSQTLTVYYAPRLFVTGPSFVYEGHEVHMSCTSDGRPLPTTEWKRPGQPWPSDLRRHPNGSVSGVLHRADRGNYECISLNAVAEARENVSLEVHYGPMNTSITVLPNKLIHQGRLINLICVTDIYPEAKHYTWRKIPAATLPEDANMANSSLTIKNFQKAHEGIYECEVTHISGRTERAYFNAILQEPTESGTGQLIGAVMGSVLCGVIIGAAAGFLVAVWLKGRST